MQSAIFGIQCLLCKNDLEVLDVANGTIHTKCSVCGHIDRPELKTIENKVFSRFNNRSVNVEYSIAKKVISKNKSIERPHYASSGLRKCK